jgi:hypothetical protein
MKRIVVPATIMLAALTCWAVPCGAGEATVRPSPLLAVDQNRATVVERIVAEWGQAFASANAGMTVDQLRTLLQGMRSDYLLAASVAGSLEGLRNVVSTSLIGAAPGRNAMTKALGDVADDLVYTPVTPCRILDTRGGGGGTMLAGQTRNWLAANPGGTFTSQGGASSNCGIPVKPAAVLANVVVFNNAAGPAFFTTWPFNQSQPLASTLNWTSAGQQIANAVILPLCTGGGCTFDFNAFTSTQTDVVIDVMGYFAAPIATALQCTQVASAATPIAVSSDTLVALPSCAAGYTRIGSQCAGTAGVPSGYLLETNATGCLYRNLSSVATYAATATAVCCRVPGR